MRHHPDGPSNARDHPGKCSSLADVFRPDRLDRPALVVAPTSLVANWRDEAQRFAPDLRVLVVHGPGRHGLHEEMPRHDLVITTYPLLLRDRDALVAQAYSVLVFDEAQSIKNAKSQAAKPETA